MSNFAISSCTKLKCYNFLLYWNKKFHTSSIETREIWKLSSNSNFFQKLRHLMECSSTSQNTSITNRSLTSVLLSRFRFCLDQNKGKWIFFRLIPSKFWCRSNMAATSNMATSVFSCCYDQHGGHWKMATDRTAVNRARIEWLYDLMNRYFDKIVLHTSY